MNPPKGGPNPAEKLPWLFLGCRMYGASALVKPGGSVNLSPIPEHMQSENYDVKFKVLPLSQTFDFSIEYGKGASGVGYWQLTFKDNKWTSTSGSGEFTAAGALNKWADVAFSVRGARGALSLGRTLSFLVDGKAVMGGHPMPGKLENIKLKCKDGSVVVGSIVYAKQR